jgi:hypothetical protein
MNNPDREYSKWLDWPGDKDWPTFPLSSMGVALRQRCGQEFETEFPHSWKGWKHENGPSDIIAYRYWWAKAKA